ncbi:Pirin-domain-containing protein [Xylona heveae TC161]|uniref:Pirin-domain-containing protein n=1 Tax=Xylona heveae (strain CBS 132557 / TC161) TaxID=1328760 RepID=A0A165IZG8_XYLHT|nr:Pirin-domain-containing protein [Xylona heveae TC161]KZF25585.1 Pirin-domain-containing protein [Xylona heveae TC161]
MSCLEDSASSLTSTPRSSTKTFQKSIARPTTATTVSAKTDQRKRLKSKSQFVRKAFCAFIAIVLALLLVSSSRGAINVEPSHNNNPPLSGINSSVSKEESFMLRNAASTASSKPGIIASVLSLSKSPLLNPQSPRTMSSTTAAAAAATHAKIVPRRSSERGHADHGWLNSYHTFSFAGYFDPAYMHFGSLRVLNEDRVAPQSGFPTHPHRDAEIFSYILSGTLTHRDSMTSGGAGTQDDNNNAQSLSSLGKDKYYNMQRNDVQFTTGGTGIAHSEMNEDVQREVHFLQIWVLPWRKGLPPTYHTMTFDEAAKREKFVTLISPLKAGVAATRDQEKEARPSVEGTIPIHADMLVAAGIVAPRGVFRWRVGVGDASGTVAGSNPGGDPEGKEGNEGKEGKGEVAIRSRQNRHVYVHIPQTANGGARVRIDGRQELGEGDGAFVTLVNAGDVLSVESIGTGEAEVIIMDGE